MLTKIITILLLILTSHLILTQKSQKFRATKINKFFQQPCFAKVNFDLDKYCENFDKRCKVCFSMAYIERCLRFCQDGDCKCDSLYLSYCKDLYSLCFECTKGVINCQCPTGLNKKIVGIGQNQCVLPECPDGQYRLSTSTCLACEPCGENCKKCFTGKNQCELCKDNYCMYKGKCVSKGFICPKGTVKIRDKQGCFDCLPPASCQPGTFANLDKGICEQCPEGCQVCQSLEKCQGCKEDYCLVNEKCVRPDSFCPQDQFKIYDSVLKMSFSKYDYVGKLLDKDECFQCVKKGQCPPKTWEDPLTKECNPKCDKPNFIWESKCIDKCPNEGDYTLSQELIFQDIENTDTELINFQSFKGNKLMKCGSEIFYGTWESGEQISRTYKGLSEKNIKATFVLLISTAWEFSDYLYISINNKEIAKISLFELQAQSKFTECGIQNQNGVKTLRASMEVLMQVTEDTAKITIDTKDVNDQSKFWAIRNWKIKVPNAHLYMKKDADGNCLCTMCFNCPEGTYCNDLNNKCDTCNEPNFFYKQKCINKCPEGTYKGFVGGKSTCVEQCPPKFFANKQGECEKCSKPCDQCIGTPETCQYPCPKPFIWKDFKCVKECPMGSFPFSPTNVNYAECNIQDDCMCGPCHENCSKCIGPKSNQCTKCKEQFLLSDGSCVNECPESKYFFQDSEEKRCECCDKICSNCTGPKINQCTACIAGATLIGTTCHLEWDVSGFTEKQTRNPNAKRIFALK